jgi:adenosylhomocysteine nucleosidase
MIVAVTGLTREARLIAGPDMLPVVGGGDAASLERKLAAQLEKGARRVLSIGICGALAPGLRVGDAIVASEIVAPDQVYPSHPSWTRELVSLLPHATLAPLAGRDCISADRAAKARLREETRAFAIDMESHVAARVANAKGLPFAALRVVSDAAHRTLPEAARIGMLPSGKMNVGGVLRSLARAPLQLPALIRTAWEAEVAFASLFRCFNMLQGGFAGANLGELVLDVT